MCVRKVASNKIWTRNANSIPTAFLTLYYLQCFLDAVFHYFTIISLLVLLTTYNFYNSLQFCGTYSIVRNCMRVCVCVHINIYIYIYIYTHTHTHTHTYVHTHLYTHIYTHIRVCVCVYIYICIWVRIVRTQNQQHFVIYIVMDKNKSPSPIDCVYAIST